MTTIVTVVAEMKAKPGKEEHLRQALVALIEPTRKEAGCLQYDLHVHTTDPGRFVFYENWTGEEHLAKHSQSQHLKHFGTLREDLLEAPPSVQRYFRIE